MYSLLTECKSIKFCASGVSRTVVEEFTKGNVLRKIQILTIIQSS